MLIILRDELTFQYYASCLITFLRLSYSYSLSSYRNPFCPIYVSCLKDYVHE